MPDVTERGLHVIKSFEGRALRAYRDVVGVWTIGYGNTNMDAFAVAYLGRKIGPGVAITEEQADYLLRESLRRGYGPAVAAAMGAPAPNEFDAGASFHYNTGAIKRAGWVARWKERASPVAIRAALVSWNKAGGRVLAGLTRRRMREADILLKSDYGPEGRLPAPVLVNGKPVAQPPLGTGLLKKGDSGPEVRAVQEQLIKVGLLKTVTGVFDDPTEAAVRKFQKSHPQLNVNGTVGPATRAALTRSANAAKAIVQAPTSTAGPAGGVIAVDQVAGGHLPVLVYVGMGLLVLAALAWVGWKYRDELTAMVKRRRG